MPSAECCMNSPPKGLTLKKKLKSFPSFRACWWDGKSSVGHSLTVLSESQFGWNALTNIVRRHSTTIDGPHHRWLSISPPLNEHVGRSNWSTSWPKRRGSNSINKWQFDHPTSSSTRSREDFWPHWENRMDQANLVKCTVCTSTYKNVYGSKRALVQLITRTRKEVLLLMEKGEPHI